MKLSIIIPVYNAVDYLEDCIKSCREAVKKLGVDAELVLIDDGSTDGSAWICDNMGDVVFHQENRGVSAARNVGMDMSHGDWLWFVDADDTIEVQDLHDAQATLNMMIQDKSFAVTGFIWSENGESETYGASPTDIPYNLWRCMFRREVIEAGGIRFTEGRKYAEDQEFLLKYLLALAKLTGTSTDSRAKQTAALQHIVYNYLIRDTSAMGAAVVANDRQKVKKMKSDILGALFSVWCYAIRLGVFPKWLFGQSKRMIKNWTIL